MKLAQHREGMVNNRSLFNCYDYRHPFDSYPTCTEKEGKQMASEEVFHFQVFLRCSVSVLNMHKWSCQDSSPVNPSTNLTLAAGMQHFPRCWVSQSWPWELEHWNGSVTGNDCCSVYTHILCYLLPIHFTVCPTISCSAALNSKQVQSPTSTPFSPTLPPYTALPQPQFNSPHLKIT